MDIDPALARLLLEKLVSFAQAAALFPPARQGRPVHPSCVARWHRVGIRLKNKQVVRLEAVRVAGRHLTSVEAVHRFIANQQESVCSPAASTGITSNRKRTSAQRSRGSEKALRALGVEQPPAVLQEDRASVATTPGESMNQRPSSESAAMGDRT